MKTLTDAEIHEQAEIAAYNRRNSTESAIVDAIAAGMKRILALAEQQDQPAAKPWPVGPFAVEKSEINNGAPYRIICGDGTEIGSAGWPERAEAIALALAWVPQAAARMRKHAAEFPGGSFQNGPTTPYGEMLQRRDALLAELDGWDMGEKKPE
jgi:hypothetical protein